MNRSNIGFGFVRVQLAGAGWMQPCERADETPCNSTRYRDLHRDMRSGRAFNRRINPPMIATGTISCPQAQICDQSNCR